MRVTFSLFSSIPLPLATSRGVSIVLYMGLQEGIVGKSVSDFEGLKLSFYSLDKIRSDKFNKPFNLGTSSSTTSCQKNYERSASTWDLNLDHLEGMVSELEANS